jgi:uncharacterized integral membrane protein
MFIFLILGAIIGALSVVFVAQNTMPISVTFLSWQIEGSLAVILTITFVGGVLMTALFSITGLISDWIESARLRRRIRSLEEELATHMKHHEAVKDVHTHDMHIHSSAEHGTEPHLLKRV